MFESTREYLKGLSLPPGDSYELESSSLRFADGGFYKWEVAGAFSPSAVGELIDALDKQSIQLNQVTHTSGVMRLLDSEIEELLKITTAAKVQLVVSVGPRGSYDTSAQRLAPAHAAHASTYRLRGMEQVIRAIEDIRRASDLGVRGFLIFDEGHLWILNRLRADGRLPREARLKASSGMGVGNPIHCRLIAEMGADSVNLQRDLDLAMIAAVRRAVSIPLDLHSDNPVATGGFIRTYELPEMIRVAAPVYVKSGNSGREFDEGDVSSHQIRHIAHQIAVESAMIDRHFKDATQSLSQEF